MVQQSNNRHVCSVVSSDAELEQHIICNISISTRSFEMSLDKLHTCRYMVCKYRMYMYIHAHALVLCACNTVYGDTCSDLKVITYGDKFETLMSGNTVRGLQ